MNYKYINKLRQKQCLRQKVINKTPLKNIMNKTGILQTDINNSYFETRNISQNKKESNNNKNYGSQTKEEESIQKEIVNTEAYLFPNNNYNNRLIQHEKKIESYTSRPYQRYTNPNINIKPKNNLIASKIPKALIKRRKLADNFFNTTMSFEKDSDAKSTTFDNNLIKELEEKNRNVNVPKIKLFPIHRSLDNQQDNIPSTERIKPIMKYFDVIKEEEELKELKENGKLRTITQRHHKLCSVSPLKITNRLIKPVPFTAPIPIPMPCQKKISSKYQNYTTNTSRTDNRKEIYHKILSLEKKNHYTLRAKHHKRLSEPLPIEDEKTMTDTNKFTPEIKEKANKNLNNSVGKAENNRIINSAISTSKHNQTMMSNMNNTYTNAFINSLNYNNKYLPTEIELKMAKFTNRNNAFTPKLQARNIPKFQILPNKIENKKTMDGKVYLYDKNIGKAHLDTSLLTLKTSQELKEEISKVLISNRILFKISEV